MQNLYQCSTVSRRVRRKHNTFTSSKQRGKRNAKMKRRCLLRRGVPRLYKNTPFCRFSSGMHGCTGSARTVKTWFWASGASTRATRAFNFSHVPKYILRPNRISKNIPIMFLQSLGKSRKHFGQKRPTPALVEKHVLTIPMHENSCC